MLNVICLKHGTKYSADYVNKLYHMVQRHLTVPHRFMCFTDDAEHIESNIETQALPQVQASLSGWWWKPYLFNSSLFPAGDVNLFFDLDTVIVNNIDKLVTYLPGEFVGLRNVSRVFRPGLKKLGSAVMRWSAEKHHQIWADLLAQPTLMTQYPGDQDWIWARASEHIKFYPDPWIRSYKWEIRSRKELEGHGKNCVFGTIKNPEIPLETAVLAFHGNPQIHSVQDPVIIQNWR
jgi:hypothetical protein